MNTNTDSTPAFMGSDLFYAPSITTPIDSLLSEYEDKKGAIERISKIMHNADYRSSFHYFTAGNCQGETLMATNLSSRLFQAEGALKALDAESWSKAMALTNVLEVMPQVRRREWMDMIKEHKTPAFEEDSVKATLFDLLNSRETFFAERIDGIFRALSGEHVTNQPQGFYKRMIMANMIDCWELVNHDKAGYVADLRAVVAQFMGRDAPGNYHTSQLISVLRRDPGKWHSIDGGTIRIKVFKKGTCHLEIHEEMAWRLNAMLSKLYPSALPPKARQRPAKPSKHFGLIHEQLSTSLLQALTETIRRSHASHDGSNLLFVPFDAGNNDRGRKELHELLVKFGGRKLPRSQYEFDYDPHPVLTEIAISGYVPEDVSHQFYSTGEALAERVVDEAQIQDGDTVLEPSAGTGAIAKFLPTEGTTCVEVAHIRCEILKAQGFTAHKADFIEWAASHGRVYDRVVMNPPFSKGRAELHLNTAAGLLASGGKLVAILPASLQGKNLLPGFDESWSEVLEDQFYGTKVRVAILTAEKTSH